MGPLSLAFRANAKTQNRDRRRAMRMAQRMSGPRPGAGRGRRKFMRPKR